MKRKLADVTNQLDEGRPARKHRLCHNRAAEAEDEVPDAGTLEERVRHTGRHFVVEYGLFLAVDETKLFASEEDPNFNDDIEFQSDTTRIQGQLRDVLALLPEEALEIRQHKWIASAVSTILFSLYIPLKSQFHDGMDGQRSTTHTRLRSESLAYIVDDTAPFETSASRFNAFSERIGYQPATDHAAAYYSPYKAEILYDKYDGTVNPTNMFRGPILLMVGWFRCRTSTTC
jgi:hypothetical protein